MFNLNFSDKTFIYLAGLQVINKYGVLLLPAYLMLLNLKHNLILESHFASSADVGLFYVPHFHLAAIFVIMEKIHAPGDLWYFSGFPVSLECLPCTQDEGCTSSSCV